MGANHLNIGLRLVVGVHSPIREHVRLLRTGYSQACGCRTLGLRRKRAGFVRASLSLAHLRPKKGLKSAFLRPPLSKPERRGTHQPKFMVGFDPDCLRLRLRLMLRIKHRFPHAKTTRSAPRAATDSLRETVSLLTT